MVEAVSLAPSLQDEQPRVYRNRAAAIASNESPVLIIRPADESVNIISDLAERNFHVQLIVIATGGTPDDIADGVIGEVHDLICRDPGFGGLAAGLLEVSSSWTFTGADESTCELNVRYRVKHYTPGNSLTKLPS